MKILYPNGEATQEELKEILELALEGRRRVKEQLKKMGAAAAPSKFPTHDQSDQITYALDCHHQEPDQSPRMKS